MGDSLHVAYLLEFVPYPEQKYGIVRANFEDIGSGKKEGPSVVPFPVFIQIVFS